MNIRDRIKDLRRVPARDLLPNPANWRKHPQGQQDALRGVLAEVGYVDALIARETPAGLQLIDGHLRAETTPDQEVPVLVVDLDDAEAAKVLATFDPLSAMAESDAGKLDELLRDIDTGSAALQEMLAELADDAGLYKDKAEIVEDEVPEPPVDPVTKPGDLWLLGEHRLLCGDSTKADEFAVVMNGAKAALCVTDPPYGVSYTGKTKDALPVHNDGKETLRPLLDAALRLVLSHTLPGACWYIAAPAGPQFHDFASVLIDIGVWRQTLVWVKQSLVMGHSDYHYQHEAIFYGWTPGAQHKSPPDRKQTTIWKFDRPTASREHPTMKPVALFAKAIENSSTVGSEICDPFLGSGTTIIAAEQMNRRCYGIEISPQYCDVIVDRWENLTGGKAQRG